MRMRRRGTILNVAHFALVAMDDLAPEESPDYEEASQCWTCRKNLLPSALWIFVVGNTCSGADGRAQPGHCSAM